MFLTPDALLVLVVDMFAYSDVNSSKDALEQWLDILQARVPGSVVLIVGGTTATPSRVQPCAASGYRASKKVGLNRLLGWWFEKLQVES